MARNWKPLVICPSAPMAMRIRSALGEQGLEDAPVLSEYPRPGAIAGLAAQQGCNLCFLDIASDPEQALMLIAEAARTLQVIAVNPRKDADLILKCLRLGACEFLSDVTGEEIQNLLERPARVLAPAEPPKPSMVLCVMPGKPGCGASTLATYLAVEMKRSGVEKVLLVDTDAVTSTVAFLLKLKSSYHLGDAVRDWSRMDEDLWSRLRVSCHGIEVLPAPDDPTIRVEFQPRAAQGLVAFWRNYYQAILLDVPGADSAGCEFAAIADEVLLVTTNELAALHATRRSMERLEKGFVDPSRLKIVVNRYAPATGLKREGVEAALKLEPYALLGNDWEAVQNAVLDGRPVDRGSHFGRSISALAERLLGHQKPAKKRSPLFGLLPLRN